MILHLGKFYKRVKFWKAVLRTLKGLEDAELIM